jgi:uncharacterized protein YbaP (TraB family)
MRRIWSSVRWGLAGLVLAGWTIGASAGVQAPAIQPTQKPLLWRIEGPVPSYLYGTIHIPDQRVLALPDVVTRAMNASDAVYTEVVLDQDTLTAAADAGQLPASQDLRKIVGDDVFARLVKIVVHAFGSNIPPGVDVMMASVLARQTPIAAMSQLVLLDYLPDLLAGRLPLDLMLHNDAVKAGKETGGIETLEEQTDVLFNSLPIDQQAKMLVAAIDEVEHQKPGENPVRHLVDLYLAGDLEPLAAELNKQDLEAAAVEKQFQSRLIDDRNVKMADRIAARCSNNKTRSYFFAVGAAHYSGETGILAQLAKKGFKVTRLTNADAGSITRKPAA